MANISLADPVIQQEPKSLDHGRVLHIHFLTPKEAPTVPASKV